MSGVRYRTRLSQQVGIVDLLAPIAALTACLLANLGHPWSGALLLGVTSVLFGLYVFFINGGRRVTAAGLFGFGFAVFVGGASLYWTNLDVVIDSNFLLVQLAALITLWLMDLFFWRSGGDVAATGKIDQKVVSIALVLAAVAFTLLLLLMVFSGGLTVVRVGAGLASLLLILLSLPRAGKAPSLLRVLLAGFVFIVFFEVFFHGFGRLVLVGIALSVLVTVSNLYSRLWLKPAMAAMSVPSLFALISVREDLVDRSGEGLDGVGSIVNPFYTMVELLQYLGDNRDPGVSIDNFVAVLLVWVPRDLWEGKPEALGRQLVYILRPELSDTSQSMAALFIGDWLYSFGVIGLVFMIPFVGLGVAFVDRLITWVIDRGEIGVWPLFVLVGLAIVAGQMPTVVWSGLFSATSRSLQGAVGVTAVFFACWLLSTTSRASHISYGNPPQSYGNPALRG